MILLWLLTFGIVNGAHLEITKFPSEPGIYFEEIEQMNLVKDTWRVVIHMSLQPFYESEARIQQYARTILRLCDQKISCIEFHNSTTMQLNELSKKLNQVRQIIGGNNRERRGLIDAIGTVSKTLFGTMDSNDEKFIDQQLYELWNNEKKLKISARKQTQIIETEFKILNETINAVESNEKSLRDAINNIRINVAADFERMITNEDVTRQFTIINSLIERLTDEVNDLLSYLIDIRLGVLNPGILPMTKLMEYLIKAAPSLPAGLRFPVALDAENSYDLNPVISITAYAKKHSIITQITLPMTDTKTYTIIQAYPLPVKVNDSVYIYREIPENNAAINTVEGEYVYITREELKQCKRVSNKLLCRPRHPVYRITSDSPCEIILYHNRYEEPKNCLTRIIKLKTTVLISLKSPQTWIYVAPKPIPITTTCNDKPTTRSSLQGSGKITINGKCIIVTSEFRLEGNGLIESEIYMDYIPNLNFSISAKEIESVQSVIPHEKGVLLKPILKDPTELNKVGLKLSELKDQLQKDDNDEWYQLKHFCTSYSIHALTILVIIIVVIYVVKRKCKPRRPSEASETEAKPTPEKRQRVSPAMRLSLKRKHSRFGTV